MPSCSPLVLLFPLVHCAAGLHHGAVALVEHAASAPALGESPTLRGLLSDGCLGKPSLLSLLQVGAGGKRLGSGKPSAQKNASAAAESNATGPVAAAADAVGSAAGGNASTAATMASAPLPTRLLRRVRLGLQTTVKRTNATRHKEVSAPEVATLQSVDKEALASLGQGDAIQGLVFSFFVLVIVAGIWCCIVRDNWPGGDFDPLLDMKRPPPHSSRRTFGNASALGRPSAGPGGAFASQFAPTEATLPRRSLVLQTSRGGPANSITGAQSIMGSQAAPMAADENSAELPMIYPSLVMPVAHTRLAVPVEPLGQPFFEVDVLGLSGVPLLSAAALERDGSRDVQISLHSISTPIAVVTQGMEIFASDSTHVGRLVRESSQPASLKYALRDRVGRTILSLSSMGGNLQDFRMTSMSGGRVVERATAVRRPRGKLPAEHYEIVANPNVDGVLALACFLAIVCFDQQTAVAGSFFRLPDPGRPSTEPRPESFPFMGNS